MQYGPTAGREHDRLELAQRFDRLALALAKSGLALALEDIADIDPGAMLDFGVAIEKTAGAEFAPGTARPRSCRSPLGPIRKTLSFARMPRQDTERGRSLKFACCDATFLR